ERQGECAAVIGFGCREIALAEAERLIMRLPVNGDVVDIDADACVTHLPEDAGAAGAMVIRRVMFVILDLDDIEMPGRARVGAAGGKAKGQVLQKRVIARSQRLTGRDKAFEARHLVCAKGRLNIRPATIEAERLLLV